MVCGGGGGLGEDRIGLFWDSWCTVCKILAFSIAPNVIMLSLNVASGYIVWRNKDYAVLLQSVCVYGGGMTVLRLVLSHI